MDALTTLASFVADHYYLVWFVLSCVVLVIAIAKSRVIARILGTSQPSPGIFAAVVLLILVSGLPQIPTGDEPHYLIMMQSIVRDGDLDLRNNYSELDYLSYYPYLIADPHVTVVGNAWYSGHGIGLALLGAPWFALAGRPGVLLMLSLIAAAGVMVLWRCLHRLGFSNAHSWLAVGVAGFTLPMASLSSQIYPEVPAFLIVTVTLTLILGPVLRPWDTALMCLCLAVLPWLHPKYEALGVALLAGALIAHRRHLRPTQIAALTGSAVGSFVALIVIYWWSKVPLPGPAPISVGALTNPDSLTSAARSVLLDRPEVGLLGTLLDQHSGLLFASPIYVLAIPGMVLLARTRPVVAVVCGLIFLSVYLPVGVYSVWYGGFDSPARFLAPVTPVLAMAIARVLDAANAATNKLFGILAAPSILHAYLVTTLPSFTRYADPVSQHDYFIAQIEHRANIDLTPVFPSFRNPGQANLLTILVYCLIIIAISLMLLKRGVRTSVDEFA